MLSPLLIRADAGPAIGTGHVMRCLALAQAWQDQGGEAHLAATMLPMRVERRLRRERVVVHKHEWCRDSGAVGCLAKEIRAEWVVIDGYELGAEYQRGVGRSGVRVMLIDDHGTTGKWSADVLLDQNLGSRASHYPNSHHATDLLLGTRYALLRREFTGDATGRETRLDGKKILVTVGGGDPGGGTNNAIVEMLTRVPVSQLEVRVVVGPATERSERLPPGGASERVSFVHDPPEMRALMEWADLAITGGGSTTWEAACVGLPLAVLALADNQRPVAERLDAAGIALHLGGSDVVALQETADRVAALLEDPDRRREMRRLGQLAVDGHGARRVVQILKSDQSKRTLPLRARAANDGDVVLLWEWASDPATRRAAFAQGPIDWRQHVAWFESPSRRRASRHFIVERQDSLPVGQVRFDLDDVGEAEVDVCVAPEQRGRGLGAAVISAGVRAVAAEAALKKIVALVKVWNAPSERAFRGAGFVHDGRCWVRGEEVLRMIYRVGRP